MSVIVKGMKMPKTCYDCIFYGGLECGLTGFGADRKSRHCPLVELPPHGRLIDADVALRSEQPPNCSDELWAETTLARCINTAPTIIEAEEEE